MSDTRGGSALYAHAFEERKDGAGEGDPATLYLDSCELVPGMSCCLTVSCSQLPKLRRNSHRARAT